MFAGRSGSVRSLQLAGSTVLITGASGGLGGAIARALHARGARVLLNGRRAEALEGLAAELGERAEVLALDLAESGAALELAERAGDVDALVANAALPASGSVEDFTHEQIDRAIDVNLRAPIQLTRALLPGMLERGRGHVVFISSVAGKHGPAYQVPYAATKAGLIGITQSLRAQYRDSPVGFSVVCPGFVAGDGMYQRMLEEGMSSNRMMGATTIDKIADTVIEAIRRNRPEAIESGGPLRPLLALAQLAPRAPEWVMPRIGATELFRRAAAARGRDS
jgi:short-subunit dehydrogenase